MPLIHCTAWWLCSQLHFKCMCKAAAKGGGGQGEGPRGVCSLYANFHATNSNKKATVACSSCLSFWCCCCCCCFALYLVIMSCTQINTHTHTPVWQLNKFCKAFYIIQQKCDMRCCCVRAFILLPCSLCI